MTRWLNYVCIYTFICVMMWGSCKKEAPQLGNQIVNGDFEGRVTDTLTLRTWNVPAKPFETHQLPHYLLGTYEDPDFGMVQTEFYTELLLPTKHVDFGNNPQLDSIVLTLDFTGFYGDPDQTHTLYVHELKESMDPTQSYTSEKTFKIITPPIGQKVNFTPNLTDSVKVMGAYKSPHLRIRLDDAFGDKILSESGGANLANNTNFRNFIKGIAILSDTTDAGGGLFKVAHRSALTTVTLYYHNDNNDALTFNFTVNDNCARANYYHLNHTGAPAHNQLNSPDQVTGEEKLYIQPLGGIRGVLKIPHITALGNIAVHKAELVLTVAQPHDDYSPPLHMRAVGIDAKGASTFLPDQLLEGASYYGGERTKATDDNGNAVTRYRFNLAHYFQHIVHHPKDNHGIYLVTFQGDRNPERLIIGGNRHDTHPIKLNLYYSPLTP